MNNASDADACIAVSFKEFDTAILKCVNIFDPIMYLHQMMQVASRAVLAIMGYHSDIRAFFWQYQIP